VLYIEQRYILRRLLRLLDSLFATPVRGEDTKRNLMHVKDRAANLADATRQGKPN
jgi:hypothetical protein